MLKQFPFPTDTGEQHNECVSYFILQGIALFKTT